jgi:hypothetical protein
MLLTERAIRQLIYNILLEGVREDADALRTLLTDATEALSQFEPLSMKPKWVNWLADRYVRSKYPADDTLEDTLPVVVSFAAADAAISQKYGSNPQFKTAVDTSFPPSERKWTNPADAAAMSTTDMSTLLTIYKRPKDKLGIDREDTSWKNDEVGTFGPWKLYFPTNQQNSINIAGADPVTHRPYTTWCTARTSGENLFYNYAGHGHMLFYAINTEATPEDPESRISIGFVRGKLEAGGQYGGITVNAKNRGLKDADLARIFGGYYTSIIARAEAVVAEHSGEHPAEAEFAAAAKDPVKFDSMLRGLSDEEAGDLAKSILSYSRNVSPEVAVAAANHKSSGVRLCVAPRRDLPLDLVVKLAGDPDTGVRKLVAHRRDLSKDLIVKLVGDSDAGVRSIIASREDLPLDLVVKLAGGPDVGVRAAIARRRDLPESLLIKLASDAKSVVRVAVAARLDLPDNITEKLLVMNDKSVTHVLALKPKMHPEVLEKLSDTKDNKLINALLQNPSTPAHVLRKLAFTNNSTLLYALAHKSASADLIRDIIKYCDSTEMPRRAKTLIYAYAIVNSNTPEDILRKLASHTDKETRNWAINKLRERGIAESHRLAHRILREIKRRGHVAN